ncbi:MAG: M14 family metallopeptidase, partial [Chloroflexi bacterium]|nr:M14 family metallopeptidase [Chloroflexota bacterium]
MAIQTPKDYLGFEVGEDRRLADWPRVVGYFTHLAEGSPRVQTTGIGRSTEGNPFILTAISSEDNLANLDRYLDIQSRLSDPRALADDEADSLIADGKTVVLITCSIHATEVGGTQMSLQLAHRLATGTDADTADILDNTIVLLVPSMNPDGLVKVKAWYNSTLGTRHEGVGPPFLYHKYAGHDNNRDWFMFNLVETRLVLEHCLNRWYPHIVVDVHQTRANGMRMILPPFTDPIEPNVSPILESQLATLGSTVAAELTAQGKSGVATSVVYDAYSPSRAYAHYHGGVRLLVETASTQIATPLILKPEDLRSTRGEHPTRRSSNHPVPWQGGRWGLPEIVDYDLAAVFAALRHAARYRDTWLRSSHRVRRLAVAYQGNPTAFVISAKQPDAPAVTDMLNVLQAAGVEIWQASAAFLADGARGEPDDCVILLNQPNGPFVKAMLEPAHYPDIRLYPGGPLKPPYDVTAHNLPLLMGVKATAIKRPFDADLHPWLPASGKPGIAMDTAPFYLIGSESNASVAVVNGLLGNGATVERLQRPVEVGGMAWPAGAYLVHADAKNSIPVSSAQQLRIAPLQDIPAVPRTPLRMPRVGLYQSHIPNTEEGWTRLVLEQYGFHYESLTNEVLKKGKLADRFDAIVLPHQPPRQLERGHGPGTYPQEYAGGLGVRGAQA